MRVVVFCAWLPDSACPLPHTPHIDTHTYSISLSPPVTTAQFPDRIQQLAPVTQVGRGLVGRGWGPGSVATHGTVRVNWGGARAGGAEVEARRPLQPLPALGSAPSHACAPAPSHVCAPATLPRACPYAPVRTRARPYTPTPPLPSPALSCTCQWTPPRPPRSKPWTARCSATSGSASRAASPPCATSASAPVSTWV
jgi:hypothetical protein